MARAGAGRFSAHLSRAAGMAGAAEPKMENHRWSGTCISGFRGGPNLCSEPAAEPRNRFEYQSGRRLGSVEPVLRGAIQDERGGAQAWRRAEVDAGVFQ